MTERGIEIHEKDRPLARAYHWAKQSAVFSITQGGETLDLSSSGIFGPLGPGLHPRGELGNRKYIFAFLGSPYPSSWRKRPDVARPLLEDRTQLYSFDVYENDEPYVVDMAHYINNIISVVGFDVFISNLDRRESDYQAYLDSVVPLREYKGNYELPELIIPNPISFERLNALDGSKILRRIKETS